jgi:hypothetical protein
MEHARTTNVFAKTDLVGLHAATVLTRAETTPAVTMASVPKIGHWRKNSNALATRNGLGKRARKRAMYVWQKRTEYGALLTVGAATAFLTL